MKKMFYFGLPVIATISAAIRSFSVTETLSIAIGPLAIGLSSTKGAAIFGVISGEHPQPFLVSIQNEERSLEKAFNFGVGVTAERSPELYFFELGYGILIVVIFLFPIVAICRKYNSPSNTGNQQH